MVAGEKEGILWEGTSGVHRGPQGRSSQWCAQRAAGEKEGILYEGASDVHRCIEGEKRANGNVREERGIQNDALRFGLVFGFCR